MRANGTEKWVVDLLNLTCRNIENQVVVAFEKRGPALEGKIKDMPVELLEMWTREANGENHIRKTVIEADEVFFKAYFNYEIDRKDTQAQAAIWLR